VAEPASVAGGPPTRFRHLVGAAMGSLSRRRSGSDQGSALVEPLPGAGYAPDSTTPSPARADSAAPLASAAALESAAPVNTAAPVHMPAPDDAHAPPSVATTDDVPAPVHVPASSEPDLTAAACLCTDFARLDETRDAAPLLQEAARIVDAVGLIVWVWDSEACELRPALSHGYSERVLAQLPGVKHDAPNATAAAFRSAQTCAVNGSESASDALVVPLMTPGGCAGVLAIELPHGGADRASVRAMATIFAAQMARVVRAARSADAADRRRA
jgi:hypothetical protein